jgi:hypothetical protein
MATTGTYDWNPAASNLTLVAFGRIGIRRTEITTQHMTDAANEMNLLQGQLSNFQPNLWRTEIVTLDLEEGTIITVVETATAGTGASASAASDPVGPVEPA